MLNIFSCGHLGFDIFFISFLGFSQVSFENTNMIQLNKRSQGKGRVGSEEVGFLKEDINPFHNLTQTFLSISMSYSSSIPIHFPEKDSSSALYTYHIFSGLCAPLHYSLPRLFLHLQMSRFQESQSLSSDANFSMKLHLIPAAGINLSFILTILKTF